MIQVLLGYYNFLYSFRRFKFLFSYFQRLNIFSFFIFSPGSGNVESVWSVFYDVCFFIMLYQSYFDIAFSEGFSVNSLILKWVLEHVFTSLIFFFAHFGFFCLSVSVVIFFFSFFLFFVFFFNFCVFFLSIICMSVILNFLHNFFASSLFKFLFFSRDFLIIEDEDFWLSYNVFNLDSRIISSKKMNIPLKHREIAVFFSLMKIFFDSPVKNFSYNALVGDLMYLRLRSEYVKSGEGRGSLSNKIIRKQSQKFYHYLAAKNLKSKLEFLDSKTFAKGGRLLSFYKIFFRDLFLTRKSKFTRLRRKRVFLRRKRLKLFVRHQRISRLASTALMNKRIQKNVNILPFESKSTQLFYNDLAKLKTKFLRRKQLKSSTLSRLFFFEMGSHNSQKVAYLRYRSGFLNFFWFSLPFYLYKTNNFLIYFSNFGSLEKFSVLLYNSVRANFSNLLFSRLEEYWETGGGMYFRKMKEDFRRTKIFQRALYSLTRSEEIILDSRTMVSAESAAESGKVDGEEVAGGKPLDRGLGSLKGKKIGFKKSLDKFESRDSDKLKYVSTNELFLKRKFGKNSKLLRLRRRQQLMVFNRKLRESRLLFFGFGKSPYRFYNLYNNSSAAIPKLKIIDLYKILEHFYFIKTNDVDFFQTMVFAAKVEQLRRKYGQSVVKDLLGTEDHKRAGKVSVNEHFLIKGEKDKFPDIDGGRDGTTFTNDLAKAEYKNKYFKQNTLESSPRLQEFTRALLVAYKYRLKK